MKKEQIMESYFQKYGVASSVAELSGILHKRFPNKKGDFKQDARDFIIWRINQHRAKEREVYHYHEPVVKYTWNPKYIKGTIRDFIRWMALDYTFNQIQNEFEQAFQGLSYAHIQQ